VLALYQKFKSSTRIFGVVSGSTPDASPSVAKDASSSRGVRSVAAASAAGESAPADVEAISVEEGFFVSISVLRIKEADDDRCGPRC
jgi:hypothetical protein